MKISVEAVSQFAFSMATCLRSGMPPGKALVLSGNTVSSKRLKRTVSIAADEVERGGPLSDGLEQSRQAFPHFVIPVIRAGELSGRLVEAFQLIHEHGQRLRPTLTLVRNTWLYPLICILFGWVVRVGILVSFGFASAAWLLVRDTVLGGVVAGLIIWGLLRARWIKTVVDFGLLQLPLVREAIIQLSATLFFATFRLGYNAGGLSILKVFDLAIATVPNTAVRRDFAKARQALENNDTFGEAFSEPALLDDEIKGSIATGAMSGRLGLSLDQIVRSETVDLEVSLGKFNRVVQILIVYGVAMSIVGTLLFCIMATPGR